MKIKLLTGALLLSSFFVMIPAHADLYDSTGALVEKPRKCTRGARKSVYVTDFPDVEISQYRTISQVREAIYRAGRENRWIMRDMLGTGDNRIEATLVVRSKHTVIVDITYTANQYSLFYKNSVNMNYASCDGKRYIHPNYAVWVSRLNQSIQIELSAPDR